MITSRDVKKEIEVAEKAVKELSIGFKIVVKLLTVVIKIGLAVRTNTVIIARKVGAKLIEPRKKEEKKVQEVGNKVNNPVIRPEQKIKVVDKKE